MQSTNITNFKPRALIVDDEESICSTLAGVLEDEGWTTISASCGLDGLKRLRENQVDLVFLDVWMEGLDGIETLQRMKEIRPLVPVVIMSGHGTIETAVKVTKLGAFDFLEKPLALEKILPILEHVGRRERGETTDTEAMATQYQLIGKSESIARIHRQIRMIAPRNSWALITGENGTGKEIIARNIHLHSLRADRAFVAVNCAAIPEDLIESELFGYTKGAFTNAMHLKRGRFELAHHGTLFLDEIGDMALKTQAKILRILQEQTFERLGGTESISVDVRVIAATNKNLKEEIKAGRFREDLFYRLNVIPIHVPSLRERREDIPLLAEFFLRKMAHELSEPMKELSSGAIEYLKRHTWPGNIRELKNLMERLTILGDGVRIDVADLCEFLPESEEDGDSYQASNAKSTLKEARSDFERSFIVDKLRENDWNVSKTAEAIGLERSNLHRKLKSYDIDTKQLKFDP